MLPNVGMGELVLILAIVLILFGAKRLPEVAKSLGKSIKAFKEGMNEKDDTNEKKEG
jgi:sec-independent protein translocase protein TatA